MRTLLISPELFLNEGGIARIMRSYLKALCDNASPGDRIDTLVLNDAVTPDLRLQRYTTGARGAFVGCGRSKLKFITQAMELGTRADQAVCGHLHLLPLLWLISRVHSDFRYSLVAHGIEVWRPFSILEAQALRGAHRILCISQYTRRQLLRFCPSLDPARLVLVPNTLDPLLAANPEGIPSESVASPAILTVSRLTAADSYKGIDTLIEALPAILQEHPRAQLRIVGGGNDMPRLIELAETLRVSKSVHFCGTVDDAALSREYASCDLFALPSRKEGFGLVYLEAMNHGKPCLAARAGGAPEVVNGEIGALADYGNISEIASAVLDLVRYPRDPAAIREHAQIFAYPVFRSRLASALN